MTTRNVETPPPADESVSGQTSAPVTGHSSTPVRPAQLLEKVVPLSRHGKAFLVASASANVIALSFISHQTVAPTLILTPDEARELAAALGELAHDLDSDARGRAWSERLLANVDMSVESYASKP